jgi:hypothetical protein
MSVSVCPRRYSAIISSRSEVEVIRKTDPHLFEHHGGMSSPEFFYASIAESWIPRVVIVREGGQVAGAVYLKERKIAGVPSGILHGDSTLGSMVFSTPDRPRPVLDAALRALLGARRIRGIRLALPPGGPELEAIRDIGASFEADVSIANSEYHRVLPLGATYEEFLQSLGSKTRRNFRYYRRRFESRKYEYVDRIPWPEFCRASIELLKKSGIGADAQGVDRALRMFSVVARPLFSGLRDRDGRWMAILGGWHDTNGVILFMQMNDDKEYGLDSLSTVLRSYWFESLISKGERKLLFWAGVGPPLSRYSFPVPMVRAYLDSRSPSWRAARSLLKWARPVLPRRILSFADWIALPPTTGTSSDGSFRL